MSDKSKDKIVFKIITLGNSGVGKTSIINRFLTNIFDNNSMTTIGLDFSLKKLMLKDGSEINISLIDTGGQEKYRSLSTSYFKNVDGILFVFSLNNKDSFDELKNWIENFNEYNTLDKKNIAKYIVGNKCDLEDKCINEGLIKEFSTINGMDYFETSAKENININNVFQQIGEVLYEEYIKSGTGNKKQLKLENKSKEKKDCICNNTVSPTI